MSDAIPIRARRAPVAVLLVFVWELAWASLVATPLHVWAKSSWGAHPEGDAVLFRPGGLELVRWITAAGAPIGLVVHTTLVLVVAGAVLGQIPLGALVASLVRRMRATEALAAGVRAFLPLSGVLVVAGIAQAILVAIGALLGSALGSAFQGSLGDARAFQIQAIVLIVFVALALVAGVVADLARVAIARDLEDRSAWAGLRAGLGAGIRTAKRALGRALVAWLWRAALGVVLIAAGSLASGAAGARGGAALFGLFVLHQGIVLARVALRASWLANALRLSTPPVAAEPQPEVAEPER